MENLIPKPEKKAPKWKDVLFYLSIFALVATIASYVCFVYFLDKATRLIQDADARIQEIGSPDQIIAEEKVLKYERKINDFAELMNNCRHTSNFLKFLETSIISGVVVTDMSLDALESTAALTGEADNFQILGEQEDFFKSSEMIDEASLKNAEINKKGKISFVFNLRVNPKMFQE